MGTVPKGTAPKSLKFMKLSQIGEFGLIKEIQKGIRLSSRVIKGIGDDAAVIRPRTGKRLLVTTDMMAEGVHFTTAMDPLAIGHKALATNISDIAAMGGTPTCAVIAFGAPSGIGLKPVMDIFQGIKNTARRFKIDVVGGDTIKTNRIVINITLLGEAFPQQLVYRSGAKPGDVIFVTGALGDSLKSGRHLKFVPRLKESQYLVKNWKPSSMIDISDGLVADLGHILEMSQVGAVLEEGLIPCHAQASLTQALYDGEDYELLFTLPRVQARQMLSRPQAGFSFYPIGEILTSKENLLLQKRNGRRQILNRKGFEHFK